MPMMKCGHASQGVDTKTNKPVCVICIGISEGATEVMEKEDLPDLTGRMATCSGCKNRPATTKPSNFNLPFFKHNPNGKEDSYYCGCYGWN